MLRLAGTGILPWGGPLVLLVRTGVLRPLRDTWPEDMGSRWATHWPDGPQATSRWAGSPFTPMQAPTGVTEAKGQLQGHHVWTNARALGFPFLKGCFCPKPLTFYGNNLMAGIPCTQGSSRDLASQERTQALTQTWPPGTSERSLSGFTEGRESVKVPFC